MESEAKVRQRIHINGIVQGVGFRPFVYNLATELALAGFVGNASHGVFIEIEGAQHIVEMFSTRLQREIPPLALIEEISFSAIPLIGQCNFTIVQSQAAPTASTFISPDLGICKPLPPGIVRSDQPSLPLSIHQLHQLWPTFHHHQRCSL